MEIWKDIKGYEGWYKVSNLGNVRSLDRAITYSNGRKHFEKGKMLKPTLKSNGYYYVSLSRNCKTPKYDIHKLVAIAFLENPNNYKCVNHIDGNKLNNNINNLEWCSYSYNAIHANKLGLTTVTKGETNGMAKLTETQVKEIKELLNKGHTGRSLANKFNVAEATISQIKNNKLWSHI